jgi:hypothetical protein
MARIGAILLLAALSALATANTFELKTEVEKKWGIREYAETTYSYYEVTSSGSRILRWHRKEGGKYSRHWISPSGKLWIMTESMPGPGGGGRTTLRSVNGDFLGSWQTYAWGTYPLTVRTKPAPTMTSAEAKVLRPKVAEQLVVSMTDGSQVHLTAYWPKRLSRPILFDERLATPRSKTSLVERVLSNQTYAPPTIEVTPGWRPIYIWHAKSTSPTLPDLTWLLAFDSVTNRPHSLDRGPELPLDHYPDSIRVTKKGYLIIFDFFDSKARLTVLHFARKFNHSVDLMPLGGFKSAEEAKSSLSWRSPLEMGKGGWTPVSQMPDDGSYGRQQIELWDKQQKRYLFTIDSERNKFSSEVFSGFAARRPKELSDPGAYKLLSEKSAASPNGKYRLRLREFQGKGIPNFRTLTLLARVQERNKTSEIEMWSNSAYKEIPFMAATNSGRAVYFEVGLMDVAGANGSAWTKKDYTALIVVGTDGNQLGYSSAFDNWGFKTLAEVRDKVLFAHTKIDSLGSPEFVKSQGLSVPAYPIERITLPIKGAEAKQFYIVLHTAMGNSYFTTGAQPWEQEMIQQALGGKKR